MSRINGLCVTCLRSDCEHMKVQPHLPLHAIRVLRLIGEGHANKEIAYRLGLTVGTVKVYITREILPALNLSNRVQVALWARDHAAELAAVTA